MKGIKKYISMALLLALVLCCVSLGTAPADAAEGNKLVAYYKFDGDLKDSSGNGNNGTGIGNITYADAKTGKGAKFDGASYIEVNDSDMLDLMNGYTISLWYYKNDIKPKSEQALVAKLGSSINSDESSYSVADHSNKPYIQYYDENKNFSYFDMNDDVDINTWVHLTASYDGTTARIYINGQLKDTNTCAGFIPASSGKLSIGCNHTDGSCFFSGVMDELRIYSGILSPADVTSIYNGSATDPATPPTTSPSTTSPSATSPSTPAANNEIVLTGKIDDRQVHLQWTQPSDTADLVGYYVYKTDGQNSVPTTDFPLTECKYIDTNPDKTNSYIVKAVYKDSTKTAVSNQLDIKLTGSNYMVLKVDDPSIVVNGVITPIDSNGTKPVIIEGRTFIPIRAVIDPMGGKAYWDGVERKVTLVVGKTTIELWIDSTTAKVNGTVKTLDVPPQIINSRTMLPLRFITENLGCETSWDGSTKTITITY